MKDEMKRLENILKTLDPTSDAYTKVLDALYKEIHYVREAAWLEHDIKNYEREERRLSFFDSTELKQGTTKTYDETVKELSAEPEPESIIPKQEPVIVKESIEELTNKPEITREYLRELLLAAPGLKKEIITKYTPEGMPVKFSSIPKSSYAAMAEELRNAK